MKVKIPKFETQKELFSWLRENKEDLIYQKKSEIKRADDDFGFETTTLHDQFAQKSVVSDSDSNSVKIRAIISTTNVRDSHKDVHINGWAKKSIKENTRIKHIQEHQMSFDKIISDKDDLKVSTKKYTWKQLGYDAEGETEALVFDSTVKEERNPVMYKEYKNGNVDNHSVGMIYVQIKLAMNSTDEGDEHLKAEYDNHIDKILNKAEVEKDGYFWAVYEAKVIEGSAVPMGSNPMTPTLAKGQKPATVEQTKADAIKEWLQKPG